MTHHSPRSHFVPKVTSKNKTSICHRVSTSFEEVCVLCPYFFERVSVFQFPQGFGSFGLSSKFVESRKLLLVGEEFPTLAPTTDEHFDSQTPILPSETLSRWNLRNTFCDFYKLDIGARVMVVKGRNTKRIGNIRKVPPPPSSVDLMCKMTQNLTIVLEISWIYLKFELLLHSYHVSQPIVFFFRFASRTRPSAMNVLEVHKIN